MLLRVISRIEKVPGEILRTLREREKAVSEGKPQLGNITNMAQVITSSQRTFIVTDSLGQDALGQCTSREKGFRLFSIGGEKCRASPWEKGGF